MDIYYELEIQKGVLFFDSDLPINMLTYLTEVKKLVDFEALKPKNIYTFFIEKNGANKASELP